MSEQKISEQRLAEIESRVAGGMLSRSDIPDLVADLREARARAEKAEAEVERLRAEVERTRPLIRTMEAAIARVNEVLADAGCDCDCDDGSKCDCDITEKCLACRVEAALRGGGS